jgi:hypothetical protein
MNEGEMPGYFNTGRLVPLSKHKGHTIVELTDIRPIVFRSHLSKIAEKAILAKVKREHSHLLRTRRYQTGFKEGRSTLWNLTDIIERISQ